MHLDIRFLSFFELASRGQRSEGKFYDFLHTQNLGYPGFSDWVERSKPELRTGYKNALVAFYGSTVVGNIVVQPHKSLGGLLELKNLRVSPEVRMRSFGRFMLDQVAAEYRGQYHALVGDVRSEQHDMRRFLLSYGFKEAGTVRLYNDEPDIIVTKFLGKASEQRIATINNRVRSLLN